METSPERTDEPDHTEDPRGEDTGQGYPETQQGGASPGGRTASGPDQGTGGAGADAPQVANEDETDRAASTGNPDAAG